ncbi:MAG: CapA family protein [Ignavibacteriae bacterium]|nr:CapA family protein [Ignavibacteriota bacterium]
MKRIAAILLFIPLLLTVAQNISSTSISVAAVGDIMMGTDYPRNRLPANDGRDLMIEVEDILKSADITFGNLEGTLLDGGEPEKECRDTNTCYIFRTPTHYVNNLSNAGFDVLSLANNHAFDFGAIGYDTTAKLLDQKGIKHSGKLGGGVKWRKNNLSIGFIAFAPNDGCNQILDLHTARKKVSKLNDSCDIVIVSFHGGAEGTDAMHIADSMEIYYNELRGNVIQFAHAVVQAGADLVIGHGPHVPRAMEIFNDRLIAYSLGNFCTYKGFSVSGAKGLAPILMANLNPKGKFLGGKITSARQVRPKGPVPDSSEEAFSLIKFLTETDFENSKIIFFDDGSFYNKSIKPPKIRQPYYPPIDYFQTLNITDAINKLTK